jgi:DNA polymerase-3 subunit delta'
MDVSEAAAPTLPWLLEPQREALKRHRGHALLVHAAAGIGALDFALALAQGWLCEGNGAERPCGRCESCKLVRAQAHPDLNVQVPEQLALALDWPVETKEGRKPSRQLKIDQVREASDWIVKTTGRGRGKVLVLHPAEAMNDQAASALLKTLEEPPAGSRVILTAADPALLLPTVSSRCQRWRLPLPPRSAALAWLDEQGVAEASVLLAAAGGRPLDALQWHRQGLTAAAWVALARAVAAGDARPLAGWPVARAVDALLELCHDAQVAALGGQPQFFPAEAVPRGCGIAGLQAWREELLRVARDADHPWNESLLLDALVGHGRAVLTPAGRGDLRGAGSEQGAFDTLGA